MFTLFMKPLRASAAVASIPTTSSSSAAAAAAATSSVAFASTFATASEPALSRIRAGPTPTAEGCELEYLVASAEQRNRATQWSVHEGLTADGRVTLRELLTEVGHPPYNHPASVINCRGLGTCGTCAVEVTERRGGLSKLSAWEAMRLALPPHRRVPAGRTIRLSCHARVLPGSILVVRKHRGMWGHHYQDADVDDNIDAVDGALLGAGFDLDRIMAARPYPPGLLGEMRSNQAGETGAVAIYRGCLAALDLRACLGMVSHINAPSKHNFSLFICLGHIADGAVHVPVHERVCLDTVVS